METFGRIWAPEWTLLIVYGAFEWIRGDEIAQNDQINSFWAHSLHLKFIKVDNEYIFL